MARPSSAVVLVFCAGACAGDLRLGPTTRTGVPRSIVSLAASARPPTAEAVELEEVLAGRRSGASPFKFIVAQTAPSVRIAFSEAFGLPPGAFSAGVLVASLTALGFDLVLDTNTAADLCVCEEGAELLRRLMARDAPTDSAEGAEPLPLFTSCCPGWVSLVESSAPELKPYLSSCRSPHMMFGSVIKTFSHQLLGCSADQVYLCSVMPCVRKRGESDRPEYVHRGVRDVDNVVTTEDLARMVMAQNVRPADLQPRAYDSPFQVKPAAALSGAGTGAGQLFGTTGGVMEAAVRSVYELVTGAPLPRLELLQVRGDSNIREATISLKDEATGQGMEGSLRVAVVHGLGAAKELVSRMRRKEVAYDFVEVMACPGGCIWGGGQPRASKEAREERKQCVFLLDEAAPIRRSHHNPIVQTLYERHLGGAYGSPRAREVLHRPPGREDLEDAACERVSS